MRPSEKISSWCKTSKSFPTDRMAKQADAKRADATVDADADSVPSRNDVTTPVISQSHNLGRSPAGGLLSRLLTWNCSTLNGVTLLEVETKAHDTKADVICVTETELPTYDSPEIQGYTMFLPKVSNSIKIRTVMYRVSQPKCEFLYPTYFCSIRSNTEIL